ncbi:MAG: cell division ATP-binding protein FtsE [Actinomycetota bacterium]|nr:cell division ATP-binding protein FtsE [Actinomycetota bacterium]
MILYDSVTKTYPRTTRPAIDGVSLEVARGEFVFIVGQSGSGKSTLLRLALKEEVATHGRVLVAGRDVSRLADRKVPALRREIGTVFQDFRLLPTKTVYQNVAFALQVIGKSRSIIRQTVPETLRTVGLEGKEKRLPHELSGGEQQRVAIARAIVNKPKILLADEPTGNLDPGISLEIVALLDRINRTGTTIVMATHDLHIVNANRKRVVELNQGHVIRDDSAGEYNTGAILMPDWDTGGHLPVSPENAADADAADAAGGGGEDEATDPGLVRVGATREPREARQHSQQEQHTSRLRLRRSKGGR